MRTDSTVKDSRIAAAIVVEAQIMFPDDCGVELFLDWRLLGPRDIIGELKDLLLTD